MLEIQAVSPTYPIKKTKKVHVDEYRTPKKAHKNNPRLENLEEGKDESTPNQHIDERV